MQRESGCKSSEIWLIGDSPPEKWKDRLSEPLDPRHPSRHNIWTPIVDGIQERVYQNGRLRVDTSHFYVRNAVHDHELKQEAGRKDWSKSDALLDETRQLWDLLGEYEPPFVFTFGAFAFEFVRRSRGGCEERPFSYWGAKRLGNEFRHSVEGFDRSKVNVFPLLHVSIAWSFLESHHYFTCDEGGNYFDYVSCKLSALLLNHKDDLNIWLSQ